MSETNEYTLRWRGATSGPFSLEEINHMLDEHEIGMGHDIFYQNEWISLEAFFVELKKSSAIPPEAPTVPEPENAPAGSRIFARLPIRVAGAPPSLAPNPAAPKTGAPRPPTDQTAQPRIRLIYAVLGILAGFSGLHNFYARHWLTGVIQFLLSVVTFQILGFGVIAPWLWAMAEALFVRTDGNGIEMT